MKKKIKTPDDQKNDFTRPETDFEKDLRAALETSAGVGDLFEDEGVYYYRPENDKVLYEVDFDAFDTEKWMQGAVQKPGALSKTLGIPEKENIPMSLINEKIATLRKKAEGDKKLSASDKKLLERLLFAKKTKSISGKKKGDLTTNGEASDGDDPRETRTDSIGGSCPLSKKKQIKKSATDMKKIEKTEDMTEDAKAENETEEKEMEGYDAEKDKKMKKRYEKEDMKKEEVPPVAPAIDTKEINDLIEKLVEEKVNEITKDFKEREKQVKESLRLDLIKSLQDAPYKYSADYLKERSLAELENDKKSFEASGMYKDFIDEQARKEDPMEINKELFKTEDFASAGADPWSTYKNRGGK